MKLCQRIILNVRLYSVSRSYKSSHHEVAKAYTALGEAVHNTETKVYVCSLQLLDSLFRWTHLIYWLRMC